MSNAEGEPVVQARAELAAAYSGPLPPPEWFRQYEEVVPGIGDRMDLVGIVTSFTVALMRRGSSATR